MKILLTGHKGLIGNELYNRLKVLHDVTGYDKGSVPFTQQEVPELIIHTAANCHIRSIIENPILAFENTQLDFMVLEHARKHNIPIIIFSSSRTNHDILNPYVASKLFLENMTRAYSQNYGLRYLIIQPETVWGLNDNPVRVIPLWTEQMIKQQTLTVYGSEDKELPPIYVEDFVDIFMSLLSDFINNRLSNTTMSIAGKPMTVDEILKVMDKVMHKYNVAPSAKIEFKAPEFWQPQKCLPATITYERKTFEQRYDEYIRKIHLRV